MKESIAKFREEAQKLEESDALKQARRKFDIVESEASKGSEVFKEKLDSVKGKLQEAVKEASQTDLARRASEYFVIILYLSSNLRHNHVSD